MSAREILETVGAIFAAGILYNKMQMDIQKAKSDVNQVGMKYGRLIALLTLWADTDAKREQLARAIEPKW
jgi:ribonuclease PH